MCYRALAFCALRIFSAENSEGFTLKQRRTATRLCCVSLQKIPLSMLALAAFFLLGALLGGMVSARGAEAMGDELRRYLEGYLALRTKAAPSFTAACQTLLCFLRASAAVFLLGFASVGVVLIPAVCAAQGFLYAYSLFCFASGLGQEGFLLLPVLFALRLLLVLPSTLLLGRAAWETSRALAAFSLGGGKRVRPVTYGKRYWSRFGIVCVCLFFGAALELWFIPHVLSLLLR